MMRDNLCKPEGIRYECIQCLKTVRAGRETPKWWVIPPGASLPEALDTDALDCTVRGFCSPTCERDHYCSTGPQSDRS